MMELSDGEYAELQALKRGHIHELLDFVAGEKPAVHGQVTGEDRVKKFQSFFDEWGYTVTYCENPTPRNDSQYAYFLGETEEAVTELQDNFRNNDDVFGQLLGFPECCIDQYMTSDVGADAAIPGKITSIETYPFYTNRFLRLAGTNLLSHFPCRYDCEESIALGKQRFELLKTYDPETAAAYKEDLSCFVVYHHDRGNVYAADYERDGNTVHHDGFETPVSWTDDDFLTLLNESDEVVLNSHQSVTVDGETIEGDDVAVAFFE